MLLLGIISFSTWKTQWKQLKTHKNYYRFKKYLQNKYTESLFLSYL